ncbi:MFS transporter [Nonomuraea spiralis]|uniref:MFS transporter n=1 Tax=Nonomuraea TaxID=83681 RepID=UPI000F78F335|nr:MFS transporter [Nonomuraea sp. WAC 01424]RSM99463.1 MFS transporter [Nonomuraea sp. WAC 01424]
MTVNESLAPHGAALPPSSPRHNARAWGVTAVLVLSSVVVFLDKALLGLVAKPMSAELGMSAAGFGTLGSASYVLFGLTCVAVSFAAQRISPRWVLLVCGLLWAVGQVPAVVAATGGMLYASRILVGAAEGPANPLSMTVLYSWFPNERRGLPQALYTAGAAVAKIALAPVLTLIIIGFGWRAGFLTVGALALGWSLLWLATGRQGPYGAAGNDRTRPAPTTRVPWRRALLNRTFIGCFIAYFAQNALAAIVFTWLPSYFENALGFSAKTAGSLFGLPSALGIVALVTTGAVTDRLLRSGVTSRRARGLLGGVCLTGAGVLLTCLPLIHTPLPAIALLMLGYGISVTVNTFANPAVAELVPPAQRAGILGVFAGLSVTAGIASPVITGWLLDRAATPEAGYTTAFLLSGVLLAVAGVLFALLVHPERDRHDALRSDHVPA